MKYVLYICIYIYIYIYPLWRDLLKLCEDLLHQRFAQRGPHGGRGVRQPSTSASSATPPQGEELPRDSTP